MAQIKVKTAASAVLVVVPVINGPSIESQVQNIANTGVWMTPTRFIPPHRITYIDVV